MIEIKIWLLECCGKNSEMCVLGIEFRILVQKQFRLISDQSLTVKNGNGARQAGKRRVQQETLSQ